MQEQSARALWGFALLALLAGAALTGFGFLLGASGQSGEAEPAVPFLLFGAPGFGLALFLGVAATLKSIERGRHLLVPVGIVLLVLCAILPWAYLAASDMSLSQRE